MFEVLAITQNYFKKLIHTCFNQNVQQTDEGKNVLSGLLHRNNLNLPPLLNRAMLKCMLFFNIVHVAAACCRCCSARSWLTGHMQGWYNDHWVLEWHICTKITDNEGVEVACMHLGIS